METTGFLRPNYALKDGHFYPIGSIYLFIILVSEFQSFHLSMGNDDFHSTLFDVEAIFYSVYIIKI